MYCKICSPLKSGTANYFVQEFTQSCISKHIWLYAYEDAHELICSSKYKGQYFHYSHHAKLLAQALYSSCGFSLHECILTFVPTQESHIQKRGYDHARLLATSVARKLNMKTSSILLPTHQNSQAQLDRSRRLENPHFLSLKNLDGRNVVLLDDVATTRSTIFSAASTLLDSGANKVVGATLAYSHSVHKSFFDDYANQTQN